MLVDGVSKLTLTCIQGSNEYEPRNAKDNITARQVAQRGRTDGAPKQPAYFLIANTLQYFNSHTTSSTIFLEAQVESHPADTTCAARQGC